MDAASKKRIAFIARKFKSMEEHLIELDNVLNEGRCSRINVNLRLKRVTDLFCEYENLHEELVELNSDNELVGKITWIRGTYYDVASRVQGMSNPDETVQQAMGQTTFLEKQRLLKLPVAELPKFDGSHDKWLSFKNTYLTMIDSRSDIDDLVKFLYLKNTLQGEALNKISVYDTSAANYKLAWGLLVESYEKKRVLVLKHLDAILDIRPLSKATSTELARLIDDARQHIGMLETLQAPVDERMVVRILERALPRETRDKWEETITLDEVPGLAPFYKFISEAIFRLSTLEQDNTRREATSGKRRTDSKAPTAKARRVGSGARALVLNATSACVKCKGDHLLYKCPEFETLNTQQRWDLVRQNRLCRNCLRVHNGACNSTHCKFCPRFHHSLLHPPRTSSRTANKAKSAAGISSEPNQTNNASGGTKQT
ncbi:uncharacterized protein LOC118648036 [Monomorium pharaonis]|uniref:uncharacterized protein LOC118648036 n=1 Tax=Monomorium pharaonis TaxID=307658 RepID=UPI001746495C|nr:uncharacterized protein LOC118648036 [Monomorium pharaonis]